MISLTPPRPLADKAYRDGRRALNEARRGARWDVFPRGHRGRGEAPPPPPPPPPPPQQQQQQHTWEAGNALEAQLRAVPDAAQGRTGVGEDAADSSRPGGGVVGEGSGGTAARGAVTTTTAPADTLRQRTRGREGAASEAARRAEKKRAPTLFRRAVPREPFTVRNQIRRTLLGSWLNVLLLAAPVGIAINYVPSVSRVAVFVVNFVAIVPLAALLSLATEEIALRTGETLGGLLNATFGYVTSSSLCLDLKKKKEKRGCGTTGWYRLVPSIMVLGGLVTDSSRGPLPSASVYNSNAVELIIAVIALVHDEVVIVQTSLIGSILSNLLLVLGMCFFVGGLRRREQYFNTTVAQTAASLLALAVAGVVVPTVLDATSAASRDDVARLSRATSVVLLAAYAAFLFFQLKTHSAVFAEVSQKVEARPFRRSRRGDGGSSSSSSSDKGTPNPPGPKTEKATHVEQEQEQEQDHQEEEPQLHFAVALTTLALSTAVIALCAEFVVGSIGAVTTAAAAPGGGLRAEFVGLVVLPAVGNAAEHATAVAVAARDKMDLAVGVAVGSGVQVALFVVPLLVVVAWGLDDGGGGSSSGGGGGGEDSVVTAATTTMTLSFDPFQVAVLFVSVLLVNYLISDGKSHWFEGMLLISLYCIIAVCSWCEFFFRLLAAMLCVVARC